MAVEQIDRPRLLTTDEAAEFLSVSRQWILDHTSGRRRPHLPSVKIGRHVRIRPADIEAFVNTWLRDVA